MTRPSICSAWVGALLVALGLYVLLQPFGVSPANCFQGWPLSAIERLQACATFSEVAASFWVGVTVAGSAIIVGIIVLARR
jgi:hypothetical protein